MVAYTIVPRNHGYWLESVADNGSRRFERFETEDAAVKRLRDLQDKAGIVKPKFGALGQRDRYHSDR
jgi:hypothetical protein